MNHRIIAGALCVISFVAIGIGYLILHPWLIGWCSPQTYCLDQSFSFGVGKPLYWSIRLLPMLFFVLIFVREQVFSVWWKIALPLGLIIIFLSIGTPYKYQGMIQYFPDRTIFTEQLVWLFVAISAVIIVWTYVRLWWKGRCAT